MPETIRLTSRLDFAAVNNLVDNLLAIPPDATIHLDAQDVTYFGSLCAQTIVAGARRMAAAGGSIELHNLTERSNEQLAAMGLNSTILVEG